MAYKYILALTFPEVQKVFLRHCELAGIPQRDWPDSAYEDIIQAGKDFLELFNLADEISIDRLFIGLAEFQK